MGKAVVSEELRNSQTNSNLEKSLKKVWNVTQGKLPENIARRLRMELKVKAQVKHVKYWEEKVSVIIRELSFLKKKILRLWSSEELKKASIESFLKILKALNDIPFLLTDLLICLQNGKPVICSEMRKMGLSVCLMH